MERVWLDTDDHNARAQAAYRKAGFTEEGRFRHAFFQDGRWSDDIRMAMLREEWAALPRLKSWELTAKAIETEALLGEEG
jgi:RimJ/RimL family protein N-acetyltransferase